MLLSGAFAVLAAAPVMAENLVIGLATAQTGGLAPYDQPNLAGLQMKIDEINAAGGIAGKFPIQTIIKVHAIGLGPDRACGAGTGRCRGATYHHALRRRPVDRGRHDDPSAGIPAISFCATTPTLPLAVGDYMFSNYPADNVQAAILAAYAVESGYKTAYILTSPDSAYTLKLPQYFGEAFTAKGGTLLGEGTFSMGQQDFGAEVTKIAAMDPKPDVIMTSAYEPISCLRPSASWRGCDDADPWLGRDRQSDHLRAGRSGRRRRVLDRRPRHRRQPAGGFQCQVDEKTGAAPDTIYIANGYDLASSSRQPSPPADSLDPAPFAKASPILKTFRA